MCNDRFEPENQPPENGYPDTFGEVPGSNPETPPSGGWAARPLPPAGPPRPPHRAGHAYGDWAPPAPRGRKRSAVEVALLAISLVIVVLLALFIFSLWALGSGLGSAIIPSARSNNPPAGTFSVLYVEGTIQNATGASYNHTATVEHIKLLAEDEGNTGILLYMNTPGGGVYESDELYRALVDYKEGTGRPIYAYMAATCASGGYYACMAADHITANYNTTTGSIGVYIALTDTSELYEKIGVKTVLIRSGENKGVGMKGVEITPEQQAVYQSSVDESYERFVSLVAQGRGMDDATARALSDGRIYTANQALANGMVDELGDWNTALDAFKELTASEPFYPNFSGGTTLSQLISSVLDRLPQSETQAALAAADALPSGVPLAYAAELAG